MVVSTNPTEELMALGLGSCIGLAIVDRPAGVAGLAHIVLPESHPRGDRGRFADLAVPDLIERMRAAGAVTRRMEAAIAGGARMFEVTGGLDIGARNEEAVRAALAEANVTLRAAQTGGSQGRTLRVNVGDGMVTVRVAGQAPVTLLEARRRSRAARSGRAGVRATAATSAGATP
ncbi:MAG TPA: chemotaxis protein CheD [Solirubrobacteraceae bacterium]|nr:chemotaxis protein CheD [Solirubrobacteraceae bacterium]